MIGLGTPFSLEVDSMLVRSTVHRKISRRLAAAAVRRASSAAVLILPALLLDVFACGTRFRVMRVESIARNSLGAIAEEIGSGYGEAGRERVRLLLEGGCAATA
jgi:hypothetical protein